MPTVFTNKTTMNKSEEHIFHAKPMEEGIDLAAVSVKSEPPFLSLKYCETSLKTVKCKKISMIPSKVVKTKNNKIAF